VSTVHTPQVLLRYLLISLVPGIVVQMLILVRTANSLV
jgi:hypothetical protein